MGGRERDVLVRADVTGDRRLVGGPDERPHQVHLRSVGPVPPRGYPRQVVVRQEHACPVVRRIAVERSLAEPVQPRVRSSVDAEAVDIAGHRVDVLARHGPEPRAWGCGRAEEVDRAEVVPEPLQRVARVEGDRRMLDGQLALVAQTERVIHELPPRPAPLRDPVLGEEVLADVVEDAVADEARRRALHRFRRTVVVRGGHTYVLGVRLPPRRIRDVVSPAVQRSRHERDCGPRRRDDEQDEKSGEDDLAHGASLPWRRMVGRRRPTPDGARPSPSMMRASPIRGG